jgi:O-antigen/teichoic acid export membrane protein
MTEAAVQGPAPDGLRGRLVRGVAANALGKIYVTVIQLVSVPALVSAWGVEDYGVWLMLSTIPTYLALSDFGFSQAATADMTMKVARGDREGALVTFQSLWCLVAIVGAALVALAGGLLFGAARFRDAAPWIADHAAVLFVLTGYAVAAQGTRVLLTGFHSSGYYALGTAVYDTFCFVEGLLVIAAAMFGSHHMHCALVLLAGRIATGTLLYTTLRQRVPWIDLGAAHARTGELQRLLRPALGAMAIPLSLALNVQGMVLVVGAVLSPAAVAIFSAVRTLSRVAVQVVGIFGRASMPEISAAKALGQKDGLAKILRMNLAVLAIVLLPAALVLALFGPEIVKLWTGGAIAPDAAFVALMAAGMVLHAVWMLATQMLLAVNGHGRAAVLALAVSTATIAAAVPAAQVFGLAGVAVVLLAGDVVLAAAAAGLMSGSEHRASRTTR